MSAKITRERRRAFLRALAVSGNQTLSAERVKVSRSWVCLQRRTDPEFDAAVRAAIAAAKMVLRDASLRQGSGHASTGSAAPRDERRGSNKPASGWGFLDGAELVVRGSNGRRTQIGRARARQWTPRVERRFLAALSATCNVKAACAEVGMHAPSAYAHRKRWLAFAEAWDTAIKEGYMRIEAALVERACNIFSRLDDVTLSPIPTMTAGEAIHLLHMHKNIARGIGGRPGKSWQRKPRTLDEERDSILRKLEAIESGRAISDEQLSADEREYARRR